MKTLQLNDKDNVIVALQDLQAGETIFSNGISYYIQEPIKEKHKFFIRDMKVSELVYMYGEIVGTIQQDVRSGQLLTTTNTKHASGKYQYRGYNHKWIKPDTSAFTNKTFRGYHRDDGRVGTANYWLFIPTVFCENRNIDAIKEAMLEQLGYSKQNEYKKFISHLVEAYKKKEITTNLSFLPMDKNNSSRLFKNIDGIKFLKHEGGCGGTREDSNLLGKLLASYIDHPNVAGATILGLGCENLQMQILLEEVKKRNPNIKKPILHFEQQQVGKEKDLIEQAMLTTFKALIEANKIERKNASLDKLVLGVKCGGSDGFSGISANPSVGYAADLLVALGGSVLLAEFPELCGVEQQMLDRMSNRQHADKFIHLMERYGQAAENAGSGFHMNPSPGNIKDGLITDAMKSNGAAKKGGNAPIVDVLNYTEPIKNTGLNLVCTPGNDVEATTGKAASGATIILFTTGLGTPTGNPICPTLKISTNDKLAERMSDIIDLSTGEVISGKKNIQEMGEEILNLCIQTASGEVIPKAVQLQQDDFIPWKKAISL